MRWDDHHKTPGKKKKWYNILNNVLIDSTSKEIIKFKFFEEFFRRGDISYIEFVLFINYANNIFISKNLINPHKMANLQNVILNFRKFKRDNTSIENIDEFILHLLIIEGASFTVSYSLIKKISTMANKQKKYQQLLTLLNIFDNQDSDDVNFMLSFLKRYDPSILNTLKRLKENKITINSNLLKILCLKKINDIKDYSKGDLDKIVELNSYTKNVKILQTISCFIYKNDVNYNSVKDLITAGIEITDIKSLIDYSNTVEELNKNKLKLYGILRIKKKLDHINSIELLASIDLKDKKENIQKIINNYTMLIKNGVYPGDAFGLAEKLNPEQLEIVLKHKDKFDEHEFLSIIDVSKRNIFQDIKPRDYEIVLLNFLKDSSDKYDILMTFDLSPSLRIRIIHTLNLDQIKLFLKYKYRFNQSLTILDLFKKITKFKKLELEDFEQKLLENLHMLQNKK